MGFFHIQQDKTFFIETGFRLLMANQRDPYEVLCVSRDSTDQEIKSAYKKLALKYHPDKNASNPEASELFKEVSYSYNILSDPEKRRQYDNSGFEAIDAQSADIKFDISNFGTVDKMCAVFLRKLGIPVKTIVSANVLDEARNGNITVRPLPLGTSISGKVEKQCAHFFGVTISEEQAQSGIVVRVTSAAQSIFKLLYFDKDYGGGHSLALQEDCEKGGKVTSAGMYFLHCQVYRFDSVVNYLTMDTDHVSAFFKKLKGFQPCEVSELKSGTHMFAVYGDNFFKASSYTIEAICANTYEDTVLKLKDIEQQILRKRSELRQFETEYRQASARYKEVTDRCSQEKQNVDELLKQRDIIQSMFAIPGGDGKHSNSPNEEGTSDPKTKKKGFNHDLKGLQVVNSEEVTLRLITRSSHIYYK